MIIKKNINIVELKTLDEVSKQITSGRRLPKEADFSNNVTDFLYFKVGDIKDVPNYKNLSYINEITYNLLKKYKINENDLILSNIGTVGKVVFFNKSIFNYDKKMILTENCLKITPNINIIHPNFLMYSLRSKKVQKEIDENTIKTAMPKLSINRALNIKLHVPDINNQEKITKLLDYESNRVVNLHKILEKIEIRNQYYADKLLNGIYTVKDMNIIESENLNYKNIKLEDLVDISIGSTPKEDFYNGDIPWITISDLGNNNFEDSKKKLTKKIKPVEKGSLLISFKLSVGVAKITKKEVCTNEAIIRIEPSKLKDNVSISYLYHYLPKILLANAGKNAYGANILNTKQINNLDIKIFQDFSEITMFLDKLDEEKEKIEKLLKLEEQRFEWLSDKLLSGEYIIEGGLDANI